MSNMSWAQSTHYLPDPTAYPFPPSANNGPTTYHSPFTHSTPSNYSNDYAMHDGAIWNFSSSPCMDDIDAMVKAAARDYDQTPLVGGLGPYPYPPQPDLGQQADLADRTFALSPPSPSKKPRLQYNLPHGRTPSVDQGLPALAEPLSPSPRHDGNFSSAATHSSPPPARRKVTTSSRQRNPRKMKATVSLSVVPSSNIPEDPLSLVSPAATTSSDALRKASSAIRRATVANQRATTQTGPQYARYYKSYAEWWAASPDERLKLGISADTPHLPITAAKVVLFLDHTRTRTRKKPNGDGMDGRVGAPTIIAIVTALEAKRVETQDDFPHDPDALRSLREDAGIRAIEAAAKHDRPKLIEEAMILKASGTSADTYTTDDLRNIGRWYFSASGTPKQLQTLMRDRAMFFLGLSVAFRGDSTRNLQLSDLFLSEVSIPDIRPGYTVPVLAILADNAKHNQTGRVEEYALMRHREPLLCGVFALATHLFLQFREREPEFVPDFSSTASPVFGKRTWYSDMVFPADVKVPAKALTYEAHNKRIHKLHDANQISITKITHAPRPTGVKVARQNGASSDGTKALGGWHSGDAYSNCYDHTLPLDALLGISGHNGRKPETYMLPRGSLVVPDELVSAVYPNASRWLKALNDRESASSKKFIDVALRNLLRLLPWLAKCLVVDLAVLLADGDIAPNHLLFSLPPFNSDVFQRFAKDAPELLRVARTKTRMALDKLPEYIAMTFQSVLSDMYMQQQNEAAARDRERLELISSIAEALDGHGFASTRMPRNMAGSRRAASASAQSSMSAFSSRTPSPGPNASSSSVASSRTSPCPTGCEFSMQSPSSTPSAGVDFTVLNVTADTPPLPALPLIRDARAEDMAQLRARFDPARVERHVWTWHAAEGKHLPSYEFGKGMSIDAMYREWVEGRDGHLPVRSLEETFGSRWRQGSSKHRTSVCRTKALADAISGLAARPRWNVEIALSFVKAHYGRKSGTAVARLLCETAGVARSDLFAAADSYHIPIVHVTS